MNKNTITINKKNVIKTLAKSVLIPLGLTVASAAHVKILGSETAILIISNNEMETLEK